jgi:2-dehydro-3-deoxyphosphogluconate aldolase / (4S)-4-hydroxy-2-oxoglutarate aldolase
MKSQAMIESSRLIAILRSPQPVDLVSASMALIEGGVTALEIPLSTPGALAAVGQLRQETGESASIGVGTVLTTDDARRAIDSGAQFLVAPIVDKEAIEFACRRLVPMLPGALTPNECLQAHHAGATFVKLFPAATLLPKYLREILAPLPMLRIVPTGGVTLDNVGDWFAAGAVAVGVGGGIFDPKLAEKREFAQLTQVAKKWTQRIAELPGSHRLSRSA